MTQFQLIGNISTSASHCSHTEFCFFKRQIIKCALFHFFLHSVGGGSAAPTPFDFEFAVERARKRSPAPVPVSLSQPGVRIDIELPLNDLER